MVEYLGVRERKYMEAFTVRPFEEEGMMEGLKERGLGCGESM